MGVLTERYPLPNSVESPKDKKLKKYFENGRKLSLLLNTKEGIEITEKAEGIVKEVVNQSSEKSRPKMDSAEYGWNPDSRKQILEENMVRTKEWELRKEERVREIMTGKITWNNLEEDIFLALTNSEGQQDKLRLAEEFFHTYGLAVDYQSRQEGPDSVRMPGIEPEEWRLIKFDKLKLPEVRKSFQKGWNSVPKIIHQ